MIIALGNANQIRIDAANMGAGDWATAPINSYDIPSGVSARPYTIEEVVLGAANRAYGALESDEAATIGIGLESGQFDVRGRIIDYSAAVVLGTTGIRGVAISPGLALPTQTASHIIDGMSLSEAVGKDFAVLGGDLARSYTHGRFFAAQVMQAAVGYAMWDQISQSRSI